MPRGRNARRASRSAPAEEEGFEDDEVDQEEEEAEDSEGGEGGYEVQKILDAKRGRGRGGAMLYFIRWKGYGSEADSWEPEENAAGAPELIEAFWKKNPDKMEKYHVGVDGQSIKTDTPGKASQGPSAKSTRSQPNGHSASRPVAVPRPRRLELSDSPTPAPHTAPASSSEPASKRRKKEEPEVKNNEEEGMDKYMKKASWEDLVLRVDDVSRGSVRGKRKVLNVYLKLTDGSSTISDNIECNKRCPQKMIAFYEGKIKFRPRTAEDDEMDDDDD